MSYTLEQWFSRALFRHDSHCDSMRADVFFTFPGGEIRQSVSKTNMGRTRALPLKQSRPQSLLSLLACERRRIFSVTGSAERLNQWTSDVCVRRLLSLCRRGLRGRASCEGTAGKERQETLGTRMPLKCPWREKKLVLMWKAFQNTEEWRISFLKYLFFG